MDLHSVYLTWGQHRWTRNVWGSLNFHTIAHAINIIISLWLVGNTYHQIPGDKGQWFQEQLNFPPMQFVDCILFKRGALSRPENPENKDPILAAACDVSKHQECYYDPTPKPWNPKLATASLVCKWLVWCDFFVSKWCACRFWKGSPLWWHLQGILLDLCGPLIICVTEVQYLPQSSAFNRGNLEKQPWQNPQ